MADRKITELDEAVAIAGDELIALVQDGVTRRASLAAIKNFASAAAPDAFTVDDWSIARGDGEAEVTIGALPAHNGAAITDIEYRLDGGSWISSGGTGSFAITGLDNDTTYDVELRALNAVGAGAASDVKQMTPEAEGDTTAPSLSSPAASADGDAAADLSVSTDEDNGTLHWVVTASATPPSKSQVKAGQDHAGATAAASGSKAVSGIGTQTDSASGLEAETTYYAHFMHEDAAGNQSDVATSASFETEAAPGGDFVSDVIALLGAKLRAFWLYDDPSHLWQDTSGSTAVIADTDPVGRVDDLSGSGWHLVQATGGNRPAYRTGPSRVLFDGSNDSLAIATPAFPIDAVETFNVFGMSGGGNFARVWSFNAASGQDYNSINAIGLARNTPSSHKLGLFANNSDLYASWSGSGAIALGLYEASKTTTVATLAVNGAPVATDSSFTALNATHTGNFQVGASAATDYAPLDCRCMIMTAALTTGERSDLRDLINARYALW